MTTNPRLFSLCVLALAAACGGPQSDPQSGDTDTDAATGATDGGDAPAQADDTDGGADDTPATTGAATGTGADESSSGDPPPPVEECDVGSSCVTVAPEGWQGPVALVVAAPGEPDPQCGGAFPFAQNPIFGADFVDGGSPVCDCQCSPDTAECEVMASLSYWDPPFGNDCNGAGDGTFQVSEGVTTAAPAPPWVDDSSAVWRVNNSSQQLVGTCEGTANAQIPTPSFGTRVVACAPGLTDDACEDGACVPEAVAPFDGRVCIYREGEHMCDDPAYPERTTYHTGWVDERACAECTCGEIQGSCSDEHFTVGYVGQDGLVWDDEQIPLDGSCEYIVIAGGPYQDAISTVAGDPVGTSCAVAPGSTNYSGTAQASDPVTVCCAS